MGEKIEKGTRERRSAKLPSAEGWEKGNPVLHLMVH